MAGGINSVKRQSNKSFRRCSVSKGIFTILVWNLFVGVTYGAMVLAPAGLMFLNAFEDIPFWVLLNIFLSAHCCIGLVQMLYLIGGLLADLHFGRYKVIMLSLFNLACGFFFSAVVGLSYSITEYLPSAATIYIIIAAGILGAIMFMVGFSGFQANVVQFGLDQLLDASSDELSMFLHWLVWTEYIGEFLVRVLVFSNAYSVDLRKAEGFLTVFVFIGFSTFLVFSCCKRSCFHCEKTARNPYLNFYKVVRFTVRHERPVGPRSAVTYSDDVRPARIDFAKQIYGGPFTTEVVEDVKTCLRIVLLLLAVTPLFGFEVATYHLFPAFGVHFSKSNVLNFKYSYEWMLFESGNLSHIITIASIPLYIVFIYPLIRKWIPSILCRMGIGAVMTAASVTLMFILEVVASYHFVYHNDININSTTNGTCLFLSDYRHDYLTLGFPAHVLIILNLLNGLSAPLLSITVLEFISAQSPHTMKGLLLGVFYAFRGLFITLGCVITFPFIHKSLWANYSGIFDCGFYYYLCLSVLGLAELVVFVMAARLYRYRERDDPPYKHQYAEEYYTRYLTQPSASGERLVDEEDYSDYGTIN